MSSPSDESTRLRELQRDRVGWEDASDDRLRLNSADEAVPDVWLPADDTDDVLRENGTGEAVLDDPRLDDHLCAGPRPLLSGVETRSGTSSSPVKSCAALSCAICVLWYCCMLWRIRLLNMGLWASVEG